MAFLYHVLLSHQQIFPQKFLSLEGNEQCHQEGRFILYFENYCIGLIVNGNSKTYVTFQER